GGGSLLLFATTVGQNFDGLRRTALLAPHGGGDPGSGPNGFQINKTAAYAGIDAAETGADVWRLVVTGRTGSVRLSRDDVLQLPLHSAALPIACVEGWSTSDQWWRGVRLCDLAALVGYDDDPPDVLVESLQRRGAFRRAALRANQVADPRSLLALYVNGEELSADHGYPARVIVPAAPGVLNTKWVARLTFGDLGCRAGFPAFRSAARSTSCCSPARSCSSGTRVCGCSRTTGGGWRCGSWGWPCCTTWCCCPSARPWTGRSSGGWVRSGAGRGCRRV